MSEFTRYRGMQARSTVPSAGYPAYGQINDFGTEPAYVWLKWSDALKDSGNAQYTRFQFTITGKEIRNYRYCSLMLLDYNDTYYNPAPRDVGIYVEEFGAKNMATSSPSKRAPTWMVPVATANPQVNTQGRDNWLANVENIGIINTLTFNIMQQDQDTPAISGGPTPPFYFYAQLKFFN